VVLTVRGLALDEVLTPAVAEALGSGTVLVGPLDRARLREAIVRPAERAPGLAFDDGLVERILDDAGAEPGQLPLVESLLARLWAHREGGSLTTRAYEAAGGVAGALAAHAELVVGTAFGSDGEQLERLRLLLTRLVVPGRDGRFVRRAVRYSELPEELRELVPPLAAGRLVVVAGGQGTAGTVELAHQSLVEHWPRLRTWLVRDREFLAKRRGEDHRQARRAGQPEQEVPHAVGAPPVEQPVDHLIDARVDDARAVVVVGPQPVGAGHRVGVDVEEIGNLAADRRQVEALRRA